MKRIAPLAALAPLAVVAVAAAGGPAVKKPVAYWHVDARVGCKHEQTCKILPPWMSSLRNPMEIAAFSDGTMYYRADVYAVGRRGPHRCDKTLFARPFSGACHLSDFGVGFIRKTSIPGLWKGPDFWVASETALVGSSKVEQVNPFAPYPADTGNPAQPGHFGLADFVKPQAGEWEDVVVTRTPLG
jgi:hypothetical protein